MIEELAERVGFVPPVRALAGFMKDAGPLWADDGQT
jgi:hypothetical protein